MYCEVCGDVMMWRCTNKITSMSKYKCRNCGNVQEEKVEYKPPVPRAARVPKHYYCKNGKYIVRSSRVGGKSQGYVGTYGDEETAKAVVEELKKHDWDKGCLPLIYEELGIQKVGRSWVCV